MPVPKILREGDPRTAMFRTVAPPAPGRLPVVGWREWAGLPGLGIARIKAKLDTGAKTSALHANSIEIFTRGGETWVRFDVTGEARDAPWHEARLADRRPVRSSNGVSEERCIVMTELALAGSVWPVEVSLTNRERMELPMLVGRGALAGRVLVDAERSWLCGRPAPERTGKAPSRRTPRKGARA